MVVDSGCPRSYAEALLKSMAGNFKDAETVVTDKWFYSFLHTSTLQDEKRLREYWKNQKKLRESIKADGSNLQFKWFSNHLCLPIQLIAFWCDLMFWM